MVMRLDVSDERTVDVLHDLANILRFVEEGVAGRSPGEEVTLGYRENQGCGLLLDMIADLLDEIVERLAQEKRGSPVSSGEGSP